MANNSWPTTLTAAQLDELMARYYSGENVSTLIREFRLPITPSHLTKMFPPEPLPEHLCPYCGAPMYLPRLSRAALQRATSPPTPYCPNCGHRATPDCRCAVCFQARRKAELAEQAKLRNRLSQALMPPRTTATRVEELSLWQALTVVALARAGRRETGTGIRSLQSQAVPLAPTLCLSTRVLKTLYEAGLIDLSLESPVESINFSGPGSMHYDPHAVSWELRLGRGATESLDILSLIETTLADDSLWPSYWYQDFSNAWQLIALHECLCYLALRLNEHGFEFRAGQKTEETFLAILENFSIAHTYNLIWSAVRDASALYLRGGIPRRRAANTVIGNCQRRAERAVAEGWTIKPYRRDYCCPESILTSIFANVVAAVGSDQFFSGIPI